jgi:hypothetical protein
MVTVQVPYGRGAPLPGALLSRFNLDHLVMLRFLQMGLLEATLTLADRPRANPA